MSEATSTTRPRHPSVDWTACEGHGGCADLLPELITLDEWGYPIVQGGPIPAEAQRRARKAVSECPTLALRITD